MLEPVNMNMATELAAAIAKVRENPDTPHRLSGDGFVLYWHPEQKSPYHFLGRPIMIVSPTQPTESGPKHTVLVIGEALRSIGERLAETYAYYFNGTSGFYEVMLDPKGFCFHR